MQHLVSAWEKLAQKEYNRQHKNVAKKVHWDLCKKNGLEQKKKWYENVPEEAVENEEVKALWDINVQCDNVIEARRSDIIFINKKVFKGIIINIAVTADVEEKEREKMKKYQDLKTVIGRLWKFKMIEIMPVTIGALEVSQKNLMGGLNS